MTRRPIVLAVDDTPGNLVALEAVLDRDFEVHVARSGMEALAMLERGVEVDVIVLDVQMPIMDGYEAASRIAHLPACRDIPIVFITATYKEDPYVKRGYEVGGIDYFSKPFDPDLVRKKLGVYASFRQRAAVLAQRERQVQDAEALLEATKRLSVADHGAVGVLVGDVHGRLRDANEAAVRILGTVDLAGWWDGDGVAIRREGQALTRVRCGDGHWRELHSSTSTLHDAGGQVVGVVLALRDVTEPKRLERELETRATQLASRAL